MTGRGHGSIPGIFLVCVVCCLIIGAAGAVELSRISPVVVNKYAIITVTPTIYPCAAGYSCMLPAAATEKGYSISGDARPCAYIQDSGQLTAEYCYRQAISSGSIVGVQKVYSDGIVSPGGSGSSGDAVQTLSPNTAIARAAGVAKPLAAVCTMDGMTYCEGSGCVDLQTDTRNCGSCGSGCMNYTGCRDGKCYTDFARVGMISKVAAVEGGQVNLNDELERRALNPQPEPPLVPVGMLNDELERRALNPQPEPPLVPVNAVNGAGTENGFLSPVFAFFAPAGSAAAPTLAPVAPASRNRGILESILSIFSPMKDEALHCSLDTDCPSHFACDQNACVKESLVATADKPSAPWGDTITFQGSTNAHLPICIGSISAGIDGNHQIIADNIQPGSDGSFSYAWNTRSTDVYPDTSYYILFWIGPCKWGGVEASPRIHVRITNAVPMYGPGEACDFTALCPMEYVCNQGICGQEFLEVQGFGNANHVWGDPFSGFVTLHSNSQSPACWDITGPGLPDEGAFIQQYQDSLSPMAKTFVIVDTSPNLAPPGFTGQNGVYTVRFHIGSCASNDFVEIPMTMQAAA